MAYVRGDTYLWADERDLHLWSSNGHDEWNESGWADKYENASGVKISQEIVDEYVVMRLAELVEQGVAAEVVDRALAKWSGNFGCEALKENARSLKLALTGGESES